MASKLGVNELVSEAITETSLYFIEVLIMILGLRVCNFEVLHDVCFGLDREALSGAKEDRRMLVELNAVIGENSVGKTSLFRSLEFLHHCLKEGLAEAATHGINIGFQHLRSRHSSADMIFDLIVFDQSLQSILCYYLRITADKHGRPRVKHEQVHSLKLSEKQCRLLVREGVLLDDLPPMALLLDLMNGKGTVVQDQLPRKTQVVDRKRPALASYGRLRDYPEMCTLLDFILSWFFCRFTDAAEDTGLRQLRDKHRMQLDAGGGGHHHLNEEGSNIANVFSYMKRNDPVHYSRVLVSLKDRMPHGSDLIKRIRTDSLTGGELKLLSLFLLLADPDPRPLILIENPDHGLYYNMIDELAKAMRDYVMQERINQIVLSTHSQNLLESLAPREVWVMYRPKGEESGSRVVNAEDLPLVKAFYDERIGMSALWYSGHLDPEQKA